MNCNQHQAVAAVAICRNCFRGVCNACAMPYQDGVACSQHCFEKAQATTRVLENAVLGQRGARYSRVVLPLFLLLIGVLFLASGLQHGMVVRFDTLAGLLFVALGIALGVVSVKFFKPINR